MEEHGDGDTIRGEGKGEGVKAAAVTVKKLKSKL
jgi:hypothetical protein